MKPVPFLFLFVILSYAAAAQQNVCTQQFSTFAATATGSPVSESDAKSIVTDILNVTGLKGNFDIRSSDNVANASAILYNGGRYVLYNPAFIGSLNEATGNDWAAVSVLAHEIGHHLNGHTLGAGLSNHSNELEADEFSGYIMQRLGATLEQAETAMKLAASIAPSSTHPGREARLAAIEKGWNRASDQLTADIEANETDSSSLASATVDNSTAPAEKPAVHKTVSAAVLEEKNIAADVVFDADRAGEYYITIKGELVSVRDGRLFLLGKLKENSSDTYPYIIENKSNRLFINSAGMLLDEDGGVVGRMQKHG